MVFLRHGVTRVVGRQFNDDRIVDIAPFWVMVGGLRSEGYFRHEGEGLAEVLEFKLRLEGIVFFGEGHSFGYWVYSAKVKLSYFNSSSRPVTLAAIFSITPSSNGSSSPARATSFRKDLEPPALQSVT